MSRVSPITESEAKPPTETASREAALILHLTKDGGNPLTPLWSAAKRLQKLSNTVTAANCRNIGRKACNFVITADEARALIWLTCESTGAPGMDLIKAMTVFPLDEFGERVYTPNAIAYMIDPDGALASGLVRLWCGADALDREFAIRGAYKHFKREEAAAVRLLASFESPEAVVVAFGHVAEKLV